MFFYSPNSHSAIYIFSAKCFFVEWNPAAAYVPISLTVFSFTQSHLSNFNLHTQQFPPAKCSFIRLTSSSYPVCILQHFPRFHRHFLQLHQSSESKVCEFHTNNRDNYIGRLNNPHSIQHAQRINIQQYVHAPIYAILTIFSPVLYLCILLSRHL